MFDNLCKFLVENFSNDFATWLLGKPIALTQLSPKELSLEPIRADALILRQSNEIVLHIEFQTQDAFLLRLARAEPYLSVKFKQQLFGAIATSPSGDRSVRTIQQLLDAARSRASRGRKTPTTSSRGEREFRNYKHWQHGKHRHGTK